MDAPGNLASATLAALPDDSLLEAVQRQTFRYFWDAAHPDSGLARDRVTRTAVPTDELITIGGSGFGIMAIIVAVERRWISRAAAVERLGRSLALLAGASRYHGAFPHFMHGRSGATIPFAKQDDGGDLVETSFLLMGLLCAREYFDRAAPQEAGLRTGIQGIWHEMEWDWYTHGGSNVLYWHWSPTHDWAIDLDIRGWNECLVTYLLAVSAPRHAADAAVYERGFAAGRDFLNGHSYYGIKLPLGPPYGGPLFFAHYSFCGIDPRGLQDRHADYWQQNVRHVRINHTYCETNPRQHKGYASDCWGLTSSYDVNGYAQHAPDHDSGTLSPTAALSSMPYAPRESLAAIRGFLTAYGDKVWGPYGFVDAFNEGQGWFADTFLAIDQGPIIVMIENHRTGLLWRLFMRVPEIRRGLRMLGFSSPHLETARERR
jgi:hypothetical protein